MKGASVKDLVPTAQALRRLKTEQSDLRSNEKLGAEIGHSGETVREILAVLTFEHDSQILALFESRQLGVEKGRQLRRLAKAFPQDPDKIRDAAKLMTSIRSHQTRDFVNHSIANPGLTVEQVAEAVAGSLTHAVRKHAVVALLGEDDYKTLAREAKSRKIDRNRLVTEIVEVWLGELRDSDG